jgi:hypothetical protein
MYNFDKKEASRMITKQYKEFIRQNPTSFFRTERTWNSIRVYERFSFSIFPFQDRLRTVFSITMIPPYPYL